MLRSHQDHRREFEELGYTVFDGVLAPAEIDEAVRVIDALLTPESSAPLVTSPPGNRNGRKQLAAGFCEPRLSRLGAHPRVLEAVGRLGLGPMTLEQSCIPAVTYKSPPGAERFDEGYHVDWVNVPPLPGDETFIFGLIHLSTVHHGGGAFMIIPGSHRVVAAALADPALRSRALGQDFRGFPGLAHPVEMRARAGSVLVFHSYLVHDRSENLLDQPRKGVFLHYKPRGGAVAGPGRPDRREKFHADDLAAMDSRVRQVCGIE